MARGRKKSLVLSQDSESFQQKCMDIAMKNLSNIEVWLQHLGMEDPFKAIQAWEKIAEFAQAKKSRDAGMPQKTEITVNFKPATKEIEAPIDDYIDITPKK
jgi:hypothetical protein